MDPSLQPKPHRLDPPANIETHLPNLFPKACPMAKCKTPDAQSAKIKTNQNNPQQIVQGQHDNPKIQKKTLTCNDKRVIIYAIKCAECHETYIGQTMRPLRA